mmetsp:Transcript_35331/g.74637  ORF Transcript_35331/g.74637 Transcript_35331/m.74637 type:complete len:431 (-) Transcript_35331:174-1466(-)
MLSSLTKSITIASLFAATPLAFTTSSLPKGAATVQPSRSSSLYNAASSGGEENSFPQRPSQYISPQEEQLNRFDLPHHTYSSSLPVDNVHGVSNNQYPVEEPRSSEFQNLEPLQHSPARLSRLEREAHSQNVYASCGSDSYWDLKDEIAQLKHDLASAIDVGVRDSAIDSIKSMLRKAQARDPEHVYRVVVEAARDAERMGNVEKSRQYMEEALRARGMMPQFNLEGLWVGKYASHGFEMINITYTGDQLVAYKVTGDKNIPRGEITFTADLSPRDDSTYQQSPTLDPISLSETSAKKWGTRQLPRFPGQGHAAEPGFVNNQFMEGQLVVIGEGDYFSFAWVPLEHQIFFGRPSPELTLKMLREGGGASLTAGVGLEVPSLDAGLREQTDYVWRCLEVTEDACWDDYHEGKANPMSGIWHGDNEEYAYWE